MNHRGAGERRLVTVSRIQASRISLELWALVIGAAIPSFWGKLISRRSAPLGQPINITALYRFASSSSLEEMILARESRLFDLVFDFDARARKNRGGGEGHDLRFRDLYHPSIRSSLNSFDREKKKNERSEASVRSNTVADGRE